MEGYLDTGLSHNVADAHKVWIFPWGNHLKDNVFFGHNAVGAGGGFFDNQRSHPFGPHQQNGILHRGRIANNDHGSGHNVFNG
jgi:hypothetical protein